MRILIAVGLAWLLAGCASAPAPFSNDACGPKPDQVGAEAAVKSYVANTNWKDADSVRTRNPTLVCMSRAIGTSPFARNRTFGWEVQLEVNAKNSYGGYTGFETKSLDLKGNALD